MSAERQALEVLFSAIRQVRKLSTDPAQPSRQILDVAERDAQRLLERHHAGSGGVW